MPLHLHENDLGVWRIDESFDELSSHLSNPDFYLPALEKITCAKRRLERLAVRVLLKKMLDRDVEILYHAHGMPYPADSSFCLSISHTKGFVAVLSDAGKRVGVDIEQRSDKVLRLRDKFINCRLEYVSTTETVLHLLLHWSGKEAVYKMLGEEGIVFSEQLIVKPFEPEREGVFQIEVRTFHTQALLRVSYKVEDAFVLTWVWET